MGEQSQLSAGLTSERWCGRRRSTRHGTTLTKGAAVIQLVLNELLDVVDGRRRRIGPEPQGNDAEFGRELQ